MFNQEVKLCQMWDSQLRSEKWQVLLLLQNHVQLSQISDCGHETVDNISNIGDSVQIELDPTFLFKGDCCWQIKNEKRKKKIFTSKVAPNMRWQIYWSESTRSWNAKFVNELTNFNIYSKISISCCCFKVWNTDDLTLFS